MIISFQCEAELESATAMKLLDFMKPAVPFISENENLGRVSEELM